MAFAAVRAISYFFVLSLVLTIPSKSPADLKSLHCNRVLSGEAVWKIGEELDRRLKENPPSKSTSKVGNEKELHQKLILRALGSAENAWENLNDYSLLAEAVADYVVVIDAVRFKESAKGLTVAERVDLQEKRLSEFRSSMIKKFLAYELTFEFGFGASEQVLLSWALRKPVVALSDTHLNTFDTVNVNQPLEEIIDHDRRHYHRGFLKGVQAAKPTFYFNELSDLSKKQRADFERKVIAGSLIILRGLEVVYDRNIFTSKRDRELASAVLFQVIHERDISYVSIDRWSKLEDELLIIASNTSTAISMPSSTREVGEILMKIRAQILKNPNPSWIPPELANAIHFSE